MSPWPRGRHQTHSKRNDSTMCLLLGLVAGAGRCVTCEELVQQMNTTGKQLWKVQCNRSLETDNFTNATQLGRVDNITACAARCSQHGNCTTNPDCCRAFTFWPLTSSTNDPNCFLNSGRNATINDTVGDGNCVRAVVVSPPPDEGPALPVSKKVCRLCSEFQKELSESEHKDWSLHCNVNIEGHDMGMLPDVPGVVDGVVECARACHKRPCDRGLRKGRKPSAFCCQAFTFIYDSYTDQNCFLKTGMTVSSIESKMTLKWNNLTGCVLTMSAWPNSFDWCKADPSCAASKEEARNALIISIISLTFSVAAAFAAAIKFLTGYKWCGGWLNKYLPDEPNKISITSWPAGVAAPGNVPGAVPGDR